jgi:hypothetical protein
MSGIHSASLFEAEATRCRRGHHFSNDDACESPDHVATCEPFAISHTFMEPSSEPDKTNLASGLKHVSRRILRSFERVKVRVNFPS